MASSIASLFGPTAEEIAYEKQQADELKRQRQLQQMAAAQPVPEAQAGYLSGYQMGGLLGGLFGPSEKLEDPRLAQSIKIRRVLGNTGASDMNDPEKLKTLGQSFSDEGLPEISLYFFDRARTLEAEEADRTYKQALLGVREAQANFVNSETGNMVEADKYGNYYDLGTGEKVEKKNLRKQTEGQEFGGPAQIKEAGRYLIDNAGGLSDKEVRLISSRFNDDAKALLDANPNRYSTFSQAYDAIFKKYVELGILFKSQWGNYSINQERLDAYKTGDSGEPAPMSKERIATMNQADQIAYYRTLLNPGERLQFFIKPGGNTYSAIAIDEEGNKREITVQ
jgi:hypothetical protein